jgi:hypothetical protein
MCVEGKFVKRDIVCEKHSTVRKMKRRLKRAIERQNGRRKHDEYFNKQTIAVCVHHSKSHETMQYVLYSTHGGNHHLLG